MEKEREKGVIDCSLTRFTARDGRKGCQRGSTLLAMRLIMLY